MGFSNVFLNNTINDKSLVILDGQSSQVIDDAAQVVLVNCKNMVIKNVVDIGLNLEIILFGTNNTEITNCKGNIILINSNNNFLIKNEFSKTNGAWLYPAVLLSNSYNNTVTQNSVVGINSCGIILRDSAAYNKIEKNNISISSSSGYEGVSGIIIDGYKNYVYENYITSEEVGLVLGGEYNVFFKNNIYQGKNSITIGRALYNEILGNNLSGASDYAICLSYSDFNNFVWNNFLDNSKVYEFHEAYPILLTQPAYYSQYNKWDNGKEGNYWSDYTGQDKKGDGIGKVSYSVYENFTDNYPLIKPYDISKIQVTFEQWDGTTIDSQSQSTVDNKNGCKGFPLTVAITVTCVAIILGVVSIIFLRRFKNGSKAKIV